jgi:hypothetical protein
LDPVAQVVFVGADFQSIVAAWESGAAAQASTAALAIKPASRQPFILLDSGRCGESIPAGMIEELNAMEDSTVIMAEWGLGRRDSIRRSKISYVIFLKTKKSKKIGGVQKFRHNEFAERCAKPNFRKISV